MENTRPLVTSDLKRLNTLRVLSFLRTHGPAARSEIATETNLARGTITGLLSPLFESGLLREVPEMLRTGRPSPKVTLSSGGRGVLVAELTIDEFRIWVGDLTEATIFEETIAHGINDGSPREVLAGGKQLLTKAVRAATAAELALIFAGVIVPAPIDQEQGLITMSSDFGWMNAPVRDVLTEGLTLPVPLTLIPDVIVGAWAERAAHMRSHAEPKTFAYLKSDTGIGSLLIHNGEFYTGAHRQSFIAPHIPVDPAGAPCVCGRRGCFLTVAGPDVTLERAGLTALQTRVGTGPALAELLRRTDAGEEHAAASIAITVRWLAYFLRLVQRTLDPDVVVLGGYWQHLVPKVESAFAAEMDNGPLPPNLQLKRASIFPAQLGSQANRIGATDRAITHYFRAGNFSLTR